MGSRGGGGGEGGGGGGWGRGGYSENMVLSIIIHNHCLAHVHCSRYLYVFESGRPRISVRFYYNFQAESEIYATPLLTILLPIQICNLPPVTGTF